MKKNRFALFILLILAILASYFIFSNKGSTISEELRDFAIEDTAAVDKIFIADKTGTQSLLERKSSSEWTVNGKFKARPDAVNMLLYTMKAMEVRSPVGKAARNHIIKDMAAKGVKVEVYQHQTLFKTFYVGGPTQDQLGTFMYLQNSTVPFIMHIPGFDGYLTTRFIVDEADWKTHSIFAFNRGEIASLIVQNRKQPDQSFELKKINDDQYELMNYPSGQKQPYNDSSAIHAYLSAYQFINYEKPLLFIEKKQLDSILFAGPIMIINTTHTNGKKTNVELFLKPFDEGRPRLTDDSGNQLPFDPDRMIARINGDTSLVLVQYFSFDKLMVKLDDLKNPAAQKRNR